MTESEAVFESEYYVNTTSKHIMWDGSEDIPDDLLTSIEALITISTRAKQKPYENQFIDILNSSGICLSPSFFVKLDGWHINFRIAKRIVETNPLAQSIYSELKNAGAFEFLTTSDVEKKGDYQGRMDTLIAIFCSCTNGFSSIEEMPKAVVTRLYSYFRTEDNMKWNRDLFGINSDAWERVFRELGLGFAKIKNDPAILNFTKHFRSTSVGRPTWRQFQSGSDVITKELLNYHTKFRKEYNETSQTSRYMAMAIGNWIKAQPNIATFEDIFNFKVEKQRFIEYMLEVKGTWNSVLMAILRSGELFSTYICNDLREHQLINDPEPLISRLELKKAEALFGKSGGSKSPSHTVSRPLPPNLFHYGEEILSEGEEGWPGKSGYFNEYVVIDGVVQQVYCPVIPSIYHIGFKLPLRIGQIKRLDSGEGDGISFDWPTRSWKKNDGALANYWNYTSVNYRNTRGYARHFPDSAAGFTGLFINTNKTGKPYNIPWENKDVHEILWNVKVWQVEFNTINFPISPIDYVDGQSYYSEETLDNLPIIFPLFRLPRRANTVPSYSQMNAAWVRLIEEIQNRWNRDNPSKQINLFVDSDAKNNSKVAIYNPHGLRVRGISKLVSAGIPIELAMKITGHSTIAMLLYYYHDVPSEMNNMLNQKMVIEIQEKSSAFIQNFTNSSFEEAKRIATYRSEAELTEIVNLPLAAKMIEYTNMDLGICPYNGARCHDGNVTYKHGSGTTRAETEKNYGPVPSAKYGCLFCRHLISGPPWLMQLWLLGNSLLEHITKIRAELETLSNELDNYERSVVDYKNDKTTMSAIDIRKMQYVRLKNEEEEVETAIFLVTEQVMAIKKIMAWEKENGCESSIALLADRDLEIHYEEMSPLVKTSILSIGGKYYPIVRNSEHNARLTKYVDQALFDSGMKPISLIKNLTDQEKLHCVQQTASVLLAKLNATELSNLSRRETTLIELDVNEDVENLLEAEIGGVIHLPRGDYRQQQLI